MSFSVRVPCLLGLAVSCLGQSPPLPSAPCLQQPSDPIEEVEVGVEVEVVDSSKNILQNEIEVLQEERRIMKAEIEEATFSVFS